MRRVKATRSFAFRVRCLVWAVPRLFVRDNHSNGRIVGIADHDTDGNFLHVLARRR